MICEKNTLSYIYYAVGINLMNLVTIFSGSGFLGRYVVRQLAYKGYFIRVVVRNPNAALLRVYGKVGQIELISGDVKEKKNLQLISKD